jgi:hypothetical protein
MSIYLSSSDVRPTKLPKQQPGREVQLRLRSLQEDDFEIGVQLLSIGEKLAPIV